MFPHNKSVKILFCWHIGTNENICTFILLLKNKLRKNTSTSYEYTDFIYLFYLDFIYLFISYKKQDSCISVVYTEKLNSLCSLPVNVKLCRPSLGLVYM